MEKLSEEKVAHKNKWAWTCLLKRQAKTDDPRMRSCIQCGRRDIFKHMGQRYNEDGAVDEDWKDARWCYLCIANEEEVDEWVGASIAKTRGITTALRRSQQTRYLLQVPKEELQVILGGTHDPDVPPSARDRASVRASEADLVWRPIPHPKGDRATPEELAEWAADEEKRRIAGRELLLNSSQKERGRLIRKAAKARVSWFQELLEPIADLLVAAVTRDAKALQCADRMVEYLNLGCSGLSAEEEDQRGAVLRQELREATCTRIRPIQGMSAEERAQLDFAADYTDEWFLVGEGAGAKALRCFYVCDANIGQEKCGTMHLSSQWKRRHANPLAAQQRWYCPCCEARYKTTSGCLVEMVFKGATHYVRADFPPESIQEVKWAAVQRAYPEASTPIALLAAIPDAAPASGVVLQPIPDHKGSWFYNREALESIPRLDWARLYHEGGGSAAAAAAAEAG